KMPQTPPVKLGLLSEDNNWIAVQGDDGKVTNKQKIKLHWECNLSPPHCENTILMHKAYQNPCVDDLVSVAQSNSNIRYQNYLKNEKEKFINDYVSTCLNVQESLVQKKNEKEYHYMLYYHDQANNLVMTVPPKAVDPLNQIQDAPKFNDINKNIQNGQHQIIHPDHNFKLASFIKYNSLNNPISVSTPDGGLTYFWYDNLGRNILSQNSEQRKEIKFSYTVFDNLNRVVEVGEIKKNAYLNVTKGKNKNNKDLFYKNYQKICQAQNGLNQFLSTGVKSQIKRTYYDTKFSSLISNQFTGGQKNLRNRVSGSTIDHNGDGVYEHGLFYSYDISGNLCEFLQHYNDMPSSISSMHEFKKIIYRYDLTSNKLIQVLYQEGQQDQFYHKYVYDEENKLIEIYTSRDGIIWKNDSRYFYYDHGPLSRQELGDQNVQGIDYAYNINGWIKGVNSTSLNPKIDIGKDALSASSNLNKVVAKDAFSYSLSYYNQDYSPIGPSYWLADITNSPLDKNELFDGNIRHMTTSLKPFMNQGGSFATIYQYDQLNRLKSMSSFQGLDSNINRWNNNNTGVYKAYNSLYEYDPAGNIAHLSRRNFDGKLMDDLFYDYYLNTNQLSYVTDKAGKFGNDIGNQSSLNYSYDENGNLIADNSKNINKIFWNQYGKIQRIERSNNDEDFYYNSLNNLVSKKTLNNHFYYARDPFGLLVASYEYDNQTKTLILKEHIIYADNRIGVDQSGIILDGNNLKDYQYVRANKQFELNNHLQNNLVTISDKKIQIPDNNVFSCYSADVLTARDYYPFGSEMFNRTYILDKEYKYGFNGKISENHSLNDDNYDFGSRIYNSQIAKFFSMDPLSNNFPANTPYSFANNMPIRCIDVNGMYPDPGDSDHKRKMHAKKTDRRIREYLSERGYEVNSKRLLTFNTGIWTNRGSIKVKDDDPWYNFWEGDFFTLYESKRVHENIGGWTNRWFRVGSNGNGVWDKESSLDGKYFNSGNPVTWKGVEDAANAYGVFFGAIATVASFGTSNLTLGAINAVFELTMMLNSADDIHKSTTGNSYLEKMGVSEEKVKQVKDILFIASITKAASEMGITLTKIQHNVSPKDILKRIKPEKRKKVIALAIKHLKKYIKEDGTDIGLDIIKISPNAAGKFGTKNSNDED
ncbi:MAG: hypothetical protein CL844_08560, partial [Crocinitomicaceae bacterium]|nr:hypothetical protein [Crocinitomicaceae bacterium]